MPKNIEIYRKHNILRRLVFVDGIARSGKSLLGPIIASLENVEIERLEACYEYVAVLDYHKKIERDAAISLIQQLSDEFLYNSLLSRNTNFRWQDHSSVFKNPQWFRYIRRLFHKEGPETLEKINQRNPIFQNMVHDQMAYVDFFFEAFPEGFQMIEIIRDPVYLIDAWLRRRLASRFGTDPLEFSICVKAGDNIVPHYAIGWEKEYLKMSDFDRTIHMLHNLHFKNRKKYESLNSVSKEKLYVLKFEDFVTNDTFQELDSIASFLSTKTTKSSHRVIKKQGCPRVLPQEKYNRLYKEIKSQCNEESNKLLQEMISDYEIEWK
tara:strand:- start:7832 stop:8800 length:969 start_codon:yes stop_codon:yes gene_type:complete